LPAWSNNACGASLIFRGKYSVNDQNPVSSGQAAAQTIFTGDALFAGHAAHPLVGLLSGD
jgi:hypothetical protein